MPVIQVQMLEGRDNDTKRELCATLARETARIIGCSVPSVYVVIQETPKRNWGIGEKMAIDIIPD